MPNFVSTELTINSDDAELIETIANRIRSDENEFDFNKIVPKDKFLDDNYNAPNEDTKEAIGIRKRLKDEFNCTSGYDWCIDNWGTKWNSNEAYSGGDGYYQFETAWSSPISNYKTIIQIISYGRN